MSDPYPFPHHGNGNGHPHANAGNANAGSGSGSGASGNGSGDADGGSIGSGDGSGDLWVDDLAGPVVRPFAVTRGRARPVAGTFELITMVRSAQGWSPRAEPGLGPEHLDIVRLCRPAYLSVAEIAAHLDLPLGTVRVLLGDLVVRELVQVHDAPTATLSDDVLEAIVDGLRAL
jgi:hypothetical protein